MAEIWLLRHGQTDWNIEGRYQGSVDQPLNDTGMEQAQEAVKRFENISVNAIYSSPLKRAYDTAKPIADTKGLSIITDERLAEISLGVWEGMLFTDIRARYPDLLEERKHNPVNFHPPEGESLLDVSKRVKAAVNEIVEKHPDEPVLIVSHGLSISTIICLANNISLHEAYKNVVENAVPIKVDWQPID